MNTSVSFAVTLYKYVRCPHMDWSYGSSNTVNLLILFTFGVLWHKNGCVRGGKERWRSRRRRRRTFEGKCYLWWSHGGIYANDRSAARPIKVVTTISSGSLIFFFSLCFCFR